MSQENPIIDWQTHAEKTDYRETPSYDETVVYAQRLASASSSIRYSSFGQSGQGRDLPVLIASESGDLTPESAHANKRAVVLIQACIHAGEPDGKDAGFALLRDVFITEQHKGLLTNVVVLFIPIYNTDGHERATPYNRINQNGPDKMGWRTTTTYQNLNRDYMKADTPETHSWLGLWNDWQPDLFIDCHVTDGADYRSVITYHHERHDGVHKKIVEWEKSVFAGKIKPATEAAGHAISWYLEFIDNRDLTLGTRDFNGSPRFSTGYTPLRNRPGILIETHMIKDYKSRVLATYDFLRLALVEVNANPARLLEVVRTADEETTSHFMKFVDQPFAIDFELTENATAFDVKAYNYKTEHSAISNDTRVVFSRDEIDITVPMYETFRTSTEIVPPRYYIVPREWTEVTRVLQLHGLEFTLTNEVLELEVECYRLKNVEWPDGPFEGRFMPRFELQTEERTRSFAAGSMLIPVAQPGARLIVNLLEPLAPDSLVRWGFFNAILEQKEYAEPYVAETLAREMIKANDALRVQFENKLASDETFRQDPSQRLNFFYKRSPYWDPDKDLYPVGRITHKSNFVAIKMSDA